MIDNPYSAFPLRIEAAEQRGQAYTESLNSQLRADPARARAEAAAMEARNRLRRQLDDGPDKAPYEVAEMLARGAAGNFTHEGRA